MAASSPPTAYAFKETALWKGAKPFITGAIAAMGATTCVQPIDMVKVRLQLAGETPGTRVGPLTIAGNIIKNEGIATFYKGLGAGLVRQLTYGTTRLGLWNILEKQFTKEDGSLPVERKLAGSLIAGGVGALIGTPADAALVRMQADTLLPANHPSRRNYKNVFDALSRMAREEGLRGFFSGASPTVYRGLAVNVGMFASYSSIKQFIEKHVDNPWTVNVVSGLLSGATAATASLPFDLIKTRLQRMRKDPVTGQFPYKGFLDCAVKSVKAEGPLVLYRGYATYVVRISPHIALTWIFLEALKTVELFK